jgi:AcrR family transcriptional regulator
MSRIDESRWIEAALVLLADGGIDAVRVEPLAERLGVTKGAFYPRYATRDDLLVAMLEYWRRESTVAVIAGLGALNESPAERLHRVLMLPFRRPDVRERARMEMAIRLWGHRDPRAAATMKEIDAYRLQYFQSVLESNGLAPGHAEARAFLVYAYIIADGTLPGERSEGVRAICRDFLSQLD